MHAINMYKHVCMGHMHMHAFVHTCVETNIGTHGNMGHMHTVHACTKRVHIRISRDTYAQIHAWMDICTSACMCACSMHGHTHPKGTHCVHLLKRLHTTYSVIPMRNRTCTITSQRATECATPLHPSKSSSNALPKSA
jgi:hypothetical protein